MLITGKRSRPLTPVRARSPHSMMIAASKSSSTAGAMRISGTPGNCISGPGVEDDFDAAIIMECGDLARTGVSGLDRFPVINIDHHPGNTAYGSLNWFDASAAACGEMVF